MNYHKTTMAILTIALVMAAVGAACDAVGTGETAGRVVQLLAGMATSLVVDP